MDNLVLQVDSSMRPLTFCSWARAISLIWDGKATVLEEDCNNLLKSPSVSIPMPLVIQIPYVVRLKPLRDNSIVKKVLFSRDNWECQYCSTSLTPKTATVDHIIPKSNFIKQGLPVAKANTWDNCVASCQDCNTKKGDKLPYQCGMYPKKVPKKPDYIQVMFLGKYYRPVHAKYVVQYYPILQHKLNIIE